MKCPVFFPCTNLNAPPMNAPTFISISAYANEAQWSGQSGNKPLIWSRLVPLGHDIYCSFFMRSSWAILLANWYRSLLLGRTIWGHFWHAFLDTFHPPVYVFCHTYIFYFFLPCMLHIRNLLNLQRMSLSSAILPTFIVVALIKGDLRAFALSGPCCSWFLHTNHHFTKSVVHCTDQNKMFSIISWLSA